MAIKQFLNWQHSLVGRNPTAIKSGQSATCTMMAASPDTPGNLMLLCSNQRNFNE